MQHAWLKVFRLHKYAPLLVGMPRSEILALDEPTLYDKGVTVGATKKILSSIKSNLNTLPWLDPGAPPTDRSVASPTPKSYRLSTSSLSAFPIPESDESVAGKVGCYRCGSMQHAASACTKDVKPALYSSKLSFEEIPPQ